VTTAAASEGVRLPPAKLIWPFTVPTAALQPVTVKSFVIGVPLPSGLNAWLPGLTQPAGRPAGVRPGLGAGVGAGVRGGALAGGAGHGDGEAGERTEGRRGDRAA